MKSKKIKVFTRYYGVQQVKLDEEDIYLIESQKVFVKHIEPRARAKHHNPIICIRPEGSSEMNDFQHLSRVILTSHGMLEAHQNVQYKDGNSFNLKKNNLMLAKRYRP